MSDITISYKGNSIATMDASGTKTLLTEGKYCEDDIEIAYVKPQSGDQTWYSTVGDLYKEEMIIPSSTQYRYARDGFNGATHLKKFIQDSPNGGSDSDYGLFRNCNNLEEVWCSHPTYANYCFKQESPAALKKATFGRIGVAVTSFQSGVFNSGYYTGIESITVYVNASDLSGVPSAVKDRIVPSQSHGAVITYKNYESGDTIATVTVE